MNDKISIWWVFVIIAIGMLVGGYLQSTNPIFRSEVKGVQIIKKVTNVTRYTDEVKTMNFKFTVPSFLSYEKGDTVCVELNYVKE